MKQTASDWLFNQLWETPKDKFTWHTILKEAKEREKMQIESAQQQKQMLIGLLDWMNKVAQDNPMALETDSDDIVYMYLQSVNQKIDKL